MIDKFMEDLKKGLMEGGLIVVGLALLFFFVVSLEVVWKKYTIFLEYKKYEEIVMNIPQGKSLAIYTGRDLEEPKTELQKKIQASMLHKTILKNGDIGYIDGYSSWGVFNGVGGQVNPVAMFVRISDGKMDFAHYENVKIIDSPDDLPDNESKN